MKPECQPFADALVDAAQPKPAGLGSHLESCVDCRALKQGHRAAQLLQGISPARATRMPVGRVLTRAGVVSVLTLVVAAAAWSTSKPSGQQPEPEPIATHPGPEQPPLYANPEPVHANVPVPVPENDPGPGPDPVREPVRVAEPAPVPEPERLFLADLARTVRGYARTSPASLRYGPRWLSPSGSQALASVRFALHPVVSTPEESL